MKNLLQIHCWKTCIKLENQSNKKLPSFKYSTKKTLMTSLRLQNNTDHFKIIVSKMTLCQWQTVFLFVFLFFFSKVCCNFPLGMNKVLYHLTHHFFSIRISWMTTNINVTQANIEEIGSRQVLMSFENIVKYCGISFSCAI